MDKGLALKLHDTELEQIITLIERPNGSRSPEPSAAPTPTPYNSHSKTAMKPRPPPKHSGTKPFRRERGRIYTVKKNFFPEEMGTPSQLMQAFIRLKKYLIGKLNTI